jgi:tetratricopeptide (TPR) repeat protein
MVPGSHSREGPTVGHEGTKLTNVGHEGTTFTQVGHEGTKFTKCGHEGTKFTKCGHEGTKSTKRGHEGTKFTNRSNPRISCVLRGVVAVAVLFLTNVAGASAQAPVPDAVAIASIRELVHAGKIADAEAELKPFEPSVPVVAYLRGLARYHADDHAGAIEWLLPVVTRLEAGTLERREGEQVLGLSLYGAGRLPEAIPYLEATRTWATTNIELHYFLGLAYLQTGKVDAAREALAVTFSQKPDEAGAHLLTAQMLIRLNLDESAAGELKRALDKDTRLPHARFLLGQMALFRGRLDESAEWTRGELRVNPGNAMAWHQLGDIYVRKAQWDEAIGMLQRSLWINPFYSAPYLLLGQAYAKKGQPGTAEGMLRRAIQYDPNNRAAHYLLAQLLQQLGRHAEAKAEFAIAEKLQGSR